METIVNTHRFRCAMLALLFLSATSAFAQVDVFYGEPVALESDFIYFTSWQYVRQGSFTWEIQHAPDATEQEQAVGAWLEGDGTRPARFVTREMSRGIRLVAEPATLEPFQPGQIAAQLFDEGKYKSWYTMSPCADPEDYSTKEEILPGHNHHVAYAESEDGVTWTYPTLGILPYCGSTENNIVFRGDLNGSTRGFHGGSVFVDPSSEDERYKMVYLGLITDAEWDAYAAKYPDEVDTKARRQDVGGYRCVFAFFGAVSPDGFHWTALPEPLMVHHADTLNTCYYDAERDEYVAYIRSWQVNPKAEGLDEVNPDGWINVGRRSIARAVSKDFRHFEKPEIVLATGADMPPSHVFYLNGKTTLPGIPNNHLLFPWIWELENDGGSVWLYSSADGATWSRVPGGPVVQTGPPGSPTGGYVTCSGDRIRLNASVQPSGYIRTSIRRFDSADPLPGRDFTDADRLVGDGIAIPVTWNGEDQIPHENQGIVLRFQLRQAKLYGVEFY